MEKTGGGLIFNLTAKYSAIPLEDADRIDSR